MRKAKERRLQHLSIGILDAFPVCAFDHSTGTTKVVRPERLGGLKRDIEAKTQELIVGSRRISWPTPKPSFFDFPL